jgi:excisionase family DNA binding protein
MPRRSDELPNLLTPTEIAAALRLSRMTLMRMIDRVELPAARVGTHPRIRRECQAFPAAAATGSRPADTIS